MCKNLLYELVIGCNGIHSSGKNSTILLLPLLPHHFIRVKNILPDWMVSLFYRVIREREDNEWKLAYSVSFLLTTWTTQIQSDKHQSRKVCFNIIGWSWSTSLEPVNYHLSLVTNFFRKPFKDFGLVRKFYVNRGEYRGNMLDILYYISLKFRLLQIFVSNGCVNFC